MIRDPNLCYVDHTGQRYCDHIHAEDLPANNPIMRGEIPEDYYEHLPGWTAQFQTRYDEDRRVWIEASRDTEIVDGRST